MKPIQILSTALLAIGGLSWGLLGLFEVDLLARFIYAAIGTAAAIQLLDLSMIQKSWNVAAVRVA